jgi:hypothetical protein
MNRLHLLGFTHDLKGVVFSQRRGSKTGTFWVPIDDAFMTAVGKLEQARRGRDAGAAKPDTGKSRDVVGLKDLPERSRALPPVGRSEPRSGLPASDIQQMLREGKTIKTVMAAAKTELAWVERLAEPVLTERAGVVRLAQRAYMLRPRLGTSGMQLGDAVERNLEERRGTIEGLDDAWDARATSSGIWRVSVRFSHRGKRRSAEWEFRKGSRQITPRNRLAGELGWWAPAEQPRGQASAGEEGAEGEESTTAQPQKAKRRPKSKPRTKARPRAKARPAAKRKAKPTAKRRAPASSKSTRAASRKKPAKRGTRRPAARRRR